MPTLYNSTGSKDGSVYRYIVGSWSAVRSAGSGGAYNSTWGSHFMRITRFSGRGAVVTGIYRSPLYFDTSGISEAPASATLKLYIDNINEENPLIAVRRSGNGSFNLTGYSTMVGNGDSPTASTQLAASDGSGGGTLASVPGLTYSGAITGYSAGYVDIPLNATALANMASLDDFSIMIMNYNYDYLDDDFPLGGTQLDIRHYATEETGTSKDPYIDYTVATAVTHNATFFGTNF